ncbi:hypothetical protein KAI87_08545 [Myxococcota bacterium]|nr:hypothetical protein [Myxococcota bacterium]
MFPPPALFVFSILLAGAQPAELPKLAILPTQLDVSAQGKVPALIDDYILTAAHNLGVYQVIGQDDIAAIVGFEQQKDLLGCDDASCFADIGGALGVDRIAIFKVALLGDDWAVTGKLINIAATKVERRTSAFIHGDTKSLLKGVPALVEELMSLSKKKISGPAVLDTPVAENKTSSTPDAEASVSDPYDSSTSGPVFGGGLLMVTVSDYQDFRLYNQKAKKKLSLDDWVAIQNEESDEVFWAELGLGGMILLSTAIGSELEETEVTPTIFIVSFLAFVPVMIMDILDVGSVDISPTGAVVGSAAISSPIFSVLPFAISQDGGGATSGWTLGAGFEF